jgi:spore germination protein YaaH
MVKPEEDPQVLSGLTIRGSALRAAPLAITATLLGAATAVAPAAVHPPAPTVIGPRNGAHSRTSAVTFRWRGHGRFEVRIARNPGFTVAMRDVFVNRRHRVTVLLPRGRWYWKLRRLTRPASRWSDARSLRVTPRRDVLPPTRPGALVVAAIGEGSLAVRFGRAHDDFGVAGYRVYANGVVRAIVHTNRAWLTGLPCATRFTIEARAFDARGHESAASPVAHARTHTCSDRIAPLAPVSLQATTIGDTSVALQWPVGVDPDGGLRGYVVTRNGRVLGHPRSAGFVARHLAPSTQYVFAVRSLDRGGHVSATATTLVVRTLAPIRTTGPLHAFVLASDGGSFADLEAHYRQVAVAYPTYYRLTPDGAITGADHPLQTRFMRDRGIVVAPRLSLIDGPSIHALLTDRGRRAALVARIAALAARMGFDGINLDLENGAPADRWAMTTFVRQLASALHAQGQILSVDVRAAYGDFPGTSQYFYDYGAIANVADEVFVMAWDLHWSRSAPGPLSDINWLNLVASYVDHLPNHTRFTVGTQLYGFDWPANGPATALEFAASERLRAAVGAVPQWDASALEPYFTYAAVGGPHIVYYANARSVGERISMIRQHGLAPGAWRLGREDQSIWMEGALQ